jgi:alkylation response protein AidB-like acyl-CoA dehydrogenase
MFVLVRTNRDGPAQRGITMLLVPLDQPGVDVRPIRNITGATDFNEMFFDGARTEVGLVVGEVDRGWMVAMTLLGFERGRRRSTPRSGSATSWTGLSRWSTSAA